MRRGLLVENPKAASTIFVQGEIGQVDDPALTRDAQSSMQSRANAPGSAAPAPDPAELQDRTTPPPFRSSCSSPSRACGCWSARSQAWSARSSCASPTGCEPGLDDLRSHAQGAPQRSALRLDHQRRARRHPVGLPRLLRTPLIGGIWAMIGSALIKNGVAGGIGAIAAGWSDGMEVPRDPMADRDLHVRRLRACHPARAVRAGQPPVGAPVEMAFGQLGDLGRLGQLGQLDSFGQPLLHIPATSVARRPARARRRAVAGPLPRPTHAARPFTETLENRPFSAGHRRSSPWLKSMSRAGIGTNGSASAISSRRRALSATHTSHAPRPASAQTTIALPAWPCWSIR
jgi:hypothetical protein